MRLERETTSVTRSPAKRLTFAFEGGAGDRALTLLYLRPGLRWIPTYRVLLPADDGAAEARLALQAEVVNEAEDLVDVPFDLVVGVPNFRFAEVVSPFALEPVLRDALREAAPQLMGQMASSSNAAFRSRAGEWRGREAPLEGPGGSVELPPELSAAGTQDLFVYSLPRLTLLRGHRAAVPILEAKAPVRHVHTWDVVPTRHGALRETPSAREASPLALSAQRVWHQIELANGGDVPWTTGAAFVLRDGRPVAQDLLTYTPRGATTRLPLTVAVDVQGEYAEEETSRTRDALTQDGRSFTRVERRALMRVVNRKSAAIDLEVTLRVGGKATEASDGARILVEPHRPDAPQASDVPWPWVNNSSTIGYRLRLEPGERKELAAAFHVFLPQ